jgi:peptidoglycan hydrolase-like protein with peptidoglycan-binding domain
MQRMLPRRVRTYVAGAAVLALALPATADARFGAKTLKQGDSGRDVKLLQKYLTKTGIDVDVDGQFGRGTKLAVRKFERAARLKVDGKVDRGEARTIKRAAKRGSVANDAPAGDTSNGGAQAGDPTGDDSGDAPGNTPGTGSGTTPPAPVAGKVTISDDGTTATAPPDAPQAVKDVVAAANKITDKPYRYGGGHGSFNDSAYDCSGAVSYALHGADLIDQPEDSTGLESWGESGVGTWITVYAKSSHAYIVIGGARFDTSGAGDEGPRWRKGSATTSGYVARHPEGL